MNISELLKMPTQVSNANSERASIIEMFVVRLNAERTGKYKPLKPSTYAIKMAHLSTSDLYWFYKKCCNAENFSKCWWGCLKQKTIGV